MVAGLNGSIPVFLKPATIFNGENNSQKQDLPLTRYQRLSLDVGLASSIDHTKHCNVASVGHIRPHPRVVTYVLYEVEM